KAPQRFAVNQHADDLLAAGLRLENALRRLVNARAFEVGVREAALVLLVDVRLHGERAVPPHVIERLEPLALRLLGQARHAVLKYPLIVLVDGDLLAGAVRRLEVAAHAKFAGRGNAPRQLDP